MLRLFLCCRLLTKNKEVRKPEFFGVPCLKEYMNWLTKKPYRIWFERQKRIDILQVASIWTFVRAHQADFTRPWGDSCRDVNQMFFSLWGLFCPTRQETRRSLFRSLKNVSKCERSVRATSPTNKTRQKLHPQNINECPPEIRDRFFSQEISIF